MRTVRPLLPSSVLLLAVLLASCAPSGTPPKAADTPEVATPEHIVLKPTEVRWVDAPPALPPGAKVAVLEGDPSKPGPFTMRIRVPAAYRIAPHEHPADEHVTVIAGSFAIGIGGAFNESALKKLPVGGFAMMRKGTRHFAWSRNGAIIQLHGVGPWGLTYVNPQDDPRNQ